MIKIAYKIADKLTKWMNEWHMLNFWFLLNWKVVCHRHTDHFKLKAQFSFIFTRLNLYGQISRCTVKRFYSGTLARLSIVTIHLIFKLPHKRCIALNRQPKLAIGLYFLFLNRFPFFFLYFEKEEKRFRCNIFLIHAFHKFFLFIQLVSYLFIDAWRAVCVCVCHAELYELRSMQESQNTWVDLRVYFFRRLAATIQCKHIFFQFFFLFIAK